MNEWKPRVKCLMLEAGGCPVKGNMFYFLLYLLLPDQKHEKQNWSWFHWMTNWVSRCLIDFSVDSFHRMLFFFKQEVHYNFSLKNSLMWMVLRTIECSLFLYPFSWFWRLIHRVYDYIESQYMSGVIWNNLFILELEI